MKMQTSAGCRYIFSEIVVLISVFSVLNFSCKKNTAQPTSWFAPETPMAKKMIAVKTDAWKVYPYIGGPDEDSVYSTWSPDLGPYLVIDSVVIYSEIRKRYYCQQSGSLMATYYDFYFYQPGASLNAPTKILLWWIQRDKTARPDADSAYFYLRY
jgi:hypothetical protein